MPIDESKIRNDRRHLRTMLGYKARACLAPITLGGAVLLLAVAQALEIGGVKVTEGAIKAGLLMFLIGLGPAWFWWSRRKKWAQDIEEEPKVRELHGRYGVESK
ncbi:MAG: hypothetical protein AAF999_15225 [Pseudomonadota bacterium]